MKETLSVISEHADGQGVDKNTDTDEKDTARSSYRQKLRRKLQDFYSLPNCCAKVVQIQGPGCCTLARYLTVSVRSHISSLCNSVVIQHLVRCRYLWITENSSILVNKFCSTLVFLFSFNSTLWPTTSPESTPYKNETFLIPETLGSSVCVASLTRS